MADRTCLCVFAVLHIVAKLSFKEKPYYGLPEFIADSLPDHCGNVVFQKWLEANNLHTRQINVVDRLSFIGKRAMGAFIQKSAACTHFMFFSS
ncbi:MAG: HipA N-terminal domain-containing protein [Prevotella sp.]|nr:HipA N-terminal domain-containing protein [Prevotella sp.]